jgi:hypothetical protein
MTTKHERTKAVQNVARQIMKLAPYTHGKSEYATIRRDEIRILHSLLRHYPSDGELDITAEKCPELWGKV